MDIESFEFEAITAAADWLSEYKPRLFLEFHFDKLRSRGVDTTQFLDAISEIGYRSVSSRNLARLAEKSCDRAGCSRLALRID
jgi:hypothetical protein